MMDTFKTKIIFNDNIMFVQPNIMVIVYLII